MSKKLLSVTVKGTNRTWCFDFYGDPKHIEDWREDGLEIDEIYNTIPMWIADAGLTSVWCKMQDIFNFKNPWRK